MTRIIRRNYSAAARQEWMDQYHHTHLHQLPDNAPLEAWVAFLLRSKENEDRLYEAALDQTIEIGLALERLKASKPHGEYMRVLGMAGWSHSTASIYRKGAPILVRVRDELKSQRVAISIRALAELVKLNTPEEIDRAMQLLTEMATSSEEELTQPRARRLVLKVRNTLGIRTESRTKRGVPVEKVQFRGLRREHELIIQGLDRYKKRASDLELSEAMEKIDEAIQYVGERLED